MSELALEIDLLTAAWKQDFFEAALSRAVRAARKSGDHLSVIRIDVDDMEEHNDMHGEERMDEAIGWLASRVGEHVDGMGPIGRVDGDEFAVYLPSMPKEKAQALAERIRRDVPRTLQSSQDGGFRLTVSVGVATLRSNEPWGNLFEAAGQACTRAKQGGRDSVVCR